MATMATSGLPLLAAYGFITASSWAALQVSRPGMPRLLAVLPTIVACLAVPHFVPGVLFRAVIGCITTWLTVFKLLSFAANRGPVANESYSVLQRMLLLLLPIHPRSPRWGPPPTPQWTVVVLAGKIAAQALVVYIMLQGVKTPWKKHGLWAISVYNMVAFFVDLGAPFVQSIMGMALNPSMNQPYLSQSIQEWWSRRYNLITTTCLRQSIYEPVIDGFFVQDGRAALLRTASSIGVSCSMVPPLPSVPAVVPSPPRARRASSSSDSDSSSSLSADASPSAGRSVRRRLSPECMKRSSKADLIADIPASDSPIKLERQPSAGKAPPSEARKSLATAAVFIASGAMHEIIFWYMCRSPSYLSVPDVQPRYVLGLCFAFFGAQPFLLQIESWITAAVRAASNALLRRSRTARRAAVGIVAPTSAVGKIVSFAVRNAWAAARILTTTYVLCGLAEYTWWASVEECRMDSVLIPELVGYYQFARNALETALQ